MRGASAWQTSTAATGPGRRRALLAHFRTMKAIGEATDEELMRVKGISAPAARSLYLALHADTQIDPA